MGTGLGTAVSRQTSLHTLKPVAGSKVFLLLTQNCHQKQSLPKLNFLLFLCPFIHPCSFISSTCHPQDVWSWIPEHVQRKLHANHCLSRPFWRRIKSHQCNTVETCFFSPPLFSTTECIKEIDVANMKSPFGFWTTVPVL